MVRTKRAGNQRDENFREKHWRSTEVPLRSFAAYSVSYACEETASSLGKNHTKRLKGARNSTCFRKIDPKILKRCEPLGKACRS